MTSIGKNLVNPSRDEPDVELRLIARVSKGDRIAFDELYRKYQVRLTRFIGSLVPQPQLVEEVLDDTLLVVWNRASSFQGKSKLSTWIFAIAYRKAKKALGRYDAPLEDLEAKNRVVDDETPEKAVGQVRLHRLLREAMLELSSDHRAVVELAYFSDLGCREVAEIMECPVNTVKTRMFYARRHLKQKLEGELSDWI